MATPALVQRLKGLWKREKRGTTANRPGSCTFPDRLGPSSETLAVRNDLTLTIVGTGGHLPQVIEIARTTNAACIRVLTDTPGAWFGDDIEVLPLDNQGEPSRTDIFIGSFTESGKNFNHTSPFVNRDLARQLKHPCVLADLTQVDLTGHAFVCGYPGAGNAIASVLTEKLIALSSSRTSPIPSHLFIGAFAADYHTKLQAALEKLLPDIGCQSFNFATYSGLHAHVIFSGSDTTAWLAGIPSRSWLHEYVHRTHERFSAKLQQMMYANARGILVVRHPLDMLISDARKLSLQGYDVLGDMDALFSIASSQVGFYESFNQTADHRLISIRYEDIRSSFSDAARVLANHINLDVSLDVLARLEREIIDQPIAHPGHLQKQKPGKWRQVLSRRHAEILQAAGLFELTAHMGYGRLNVSDFPESSGAFPVDQLYPYTWPRLYGELAQRLDSWHIGMGHPENLIVRRINGRHMLAASSKNVFSTISTTIISGDLGSIIEAGRPVSPWE